MQVETFHSDDYAGLESGKFDFYYGYEVVNPKNEDEWCFQIKEKGKVIYTLTTEEIHKLCKDNQLDNPQDYLLAGIGIWLLFKK